MKARIVLCGGISGYNATKPGPANLITLRARLEGFIVLALHASCGRSH